LDFCAATLLAKLLRKSIKALNINFNEAYLWTESSIVLSWIQVPPNKWKTFIGNRVAFIQEETASATWKHVPTHSNPADLISRGIETATPENCNRWWKGPPWLTQKQTSWPSLTFSKPTEDLEVRLVFAAVSPEDITSRFSDFNKLLRVIAYIRRFIHNCRHQKAHKQFEHLSTQELQHARTLCVKLIQETAFSHEIQDLTRRREVSSTSSLKTLHPFIDKEV
jgi:hypothetical protein